MPLRHVASKPPGPFTGFPKAGVDFFRALSVTQDRVWFAANRESYEALWLQPMQTLLSTLQPPLEKLYRRKLSSKIFRLNRDVRFSKDKRPYKTNIAARIGFEGADGPMGGPVVLYLHLGLEEWVGAGFYALEPEQLALLRKRVMAEKTGAALQALLAQAERDGLSLTSMEQLKRAPAGVPVDHPRIEILKHKGIALGVETIPRKIRFTAALAPWLLEQARAAQPVVAWGLAQKLA
jgi:uncharacterized protein (TIGR02453 family)